MDITPIPVLDDNYIWLLQHDELVVCVDPGVAEPVEAYLTQHDASLSAIWLTHHHPDHVGGVARLQRRYPQAAVYGPLALARHAVGEGSRLAAGQYAAAVWAVPGHTRDHLAYVLDVDGRLHVFCGDTLFSAGCGRIFDGSIPQLYSALQRLCRLPENTLFYPAHEYTAANLRFAAAVEPDNPQIQAACLQAVHTPTLPVSLAHERQINPFLRTAQPAVREAAARWAAKPLVDDLAVFSALRQWKNQF